MIYVFEVTLSKGISLTDYIKAWRRGSEIIQRSAGARGIRLYQKIGSQDKLLNIAHWDSAISREMAMETLRHADAATHMLLHKHEDFGSVRIIGGYDEAASVAAADPENYKPKH